MNVHNNSSSGHLLSPLVANLAGLTVGDLAPVRIMAVLNVSPESFHQGSVQTNLQNIAETAEAMASAGADIIDIGAMSTAPYLKTHISEEEETLRLVRAIEAVVTRVTIPVSVDYRVAVPGSDSVGGYRHDFDLRSALNSRSRNF